MVFDAVPIFNSSGEMLAAIETLHDHTESKEIESEKGKMVSELQTHVTGSMSLKGFVRICASCKDIRSKEGVWTPVEVYFRDKAGLQFSHGVCPKCARKLCPDLFDKDGS
jgi:hypothetical protein